MQDVQHLLLLPFLSLQCVCCAVAHLSFSNVVGCFRLFYLEERCLTLCLEVVGGALENLCLDEGDVAGGELCRLFLCLLSMLCFGSGALSRLVLWW